MSEKKGFLKLKRNVVRFYAGKKVPLKYQARFGKIYSKEEATSIAYAIATRRGI